MERKGKSQSTSCHGGYLYVKPGMKIATDGEIFEGISSLDESMATGESIPVTKKSGGEVIGATMKP